jgi:hypothetical protein
MTEVFRLTPEVGKRYRYAEATSRQGSYPTQKYFTTNEVHYVGVFKEHLQYGYRDNAIHIGVFDNYGTEVRVNYSYDGNTCFIEIPQPRINSDIKLELIHTVKTRPIPKLRDIVMRTLSTEEVNYAMRLFN